MRLAEARAPVDEQWVVRLRRRLGDRQRRGVGEAVRRADDERVERVLHVETPAFGPGGNALDHGNDVLRTRAILRDLQFDDTFATEDVAYGCTDEAEEVAFDPVTRELARDDEHECVVVELKAADIAEPLAVGPIAERLPQPPRDLLPKALCRQLELVLHRRLGPPAFRPGGQHNSASDEDKTGLCAGILSPLHIPPQVWIGVGGTCSSRIAEPSAAVEKPVDEARLYWPPRPAVRGDFSGRDELFYSRE